jgi:hypothetical protein
MTRGVLYIASGSGFAREAILSAESVKENNSQIPITMITDQPISSEFIDNIIKIEDDVETFANKPFNMSRTPYEKTLYLDTDTYICSDISDIFELLEKYDIAATHNQKGTSYTIGDIPNAFPEYSSGVIGFRDNKLVTNFLSTWKSYYQQDTREEYPEDQPSFRKALYDSDLKLATLPREYNCAVRMPGYLNDEVKILHSRLIDINTPGASKFFGFEVPDVAKKINETHEQRLYWGWRKFRMKTGPWDSPWSRLLLSFRNNGFKYTTRRAWQESKKLFVGK